MYSMSKIRLILFYIISLVVLALTALGVIFLHDVSKEVRGVFFLSYVIGTLVVLLKTYKDGYFSDPHRAFWPAGLLWFFLSFLADGWLACSLRFVCEAGLPIFLLYNYLIRDN